MKRYLTILTLACGLCLTGGERKKVVALYKTSVLMKSRKRISETRWTRVPCKHCHGTGHRIVVVHRGNTSYRLLAPCPWCSGRGTRGLSKK